MAILSKSHKRALEQLASHWHMSDILHLQENKIMTVISNQISPKTLKKAGNIRQELLVVLELIQWMYNGASLLLRTMTD